LFAELTCEEIAAGLDCVVEETLDEVGIRQPPVDAIAVARSLGIAVALDDRQHGRARYVRLANQWSEHPKPTILIKPEPRAERRQWAIAHEIGEHLASRVFAAWGLDPRETMPNAREHTANQMAVRLLLPTAWFEPDATQCSWNLLALKLRYPTASHELIARRMLQCRPAVIITVFDQGRVTFRQGNLSNRVPPPTPAEMLCWKQTHDSCRPCRIRQNAKLVQGWPVHEEGWRREILRMETGEYGDE
jgi:hypothetical protein